MAGRGRAPKDPSKQLGHRTKAELAQTELEQPEELAGPDLPETYRAVEVTYSEKNQRIEEHVVREYLPETRDWFSDWRSSPQVSLFTVTAWRRLLMLAPLVDEFHRSGDSKLMAEIRQNEAKLGATPEDMQRLHWKAPEQPKPAAEPKPARRLKVV